MKKTLYYFIPYLKTYKKEFAIALAGMMLAAAGSTLSAHLLKSVIDDMFIKHDRNLLVLMPFMIIGVFSMKAFGSFIQSYYMIYVGEDVVRKLRDKLVSHLMSLDMKFLQMMRNGELISRITSDITRIHFFISSMIPQILSNSVLLIALCGYVLYQNAKLTLYFFMRVPLIAFPIYYLSKKMKKYSHRSQESTSDMTARLTEIFNNVEIIKANSSQTYEFKRFQEESHKVFRLLMKQNRIGMLSSPAGSIVGSVALAIVIYIGGTEVMNGKMTTGAFFSFMTAMFMLYDPIKRLSNIHTNMQDAVAALERIESIQQRQSSIKEGSRIADDIKKIVFENVSLNYGEKNALKNISLTAEKGKVYALVGDSGAGKSSLINLLVRFYEPDKGKILINSYPIEEYKLDSLLGRISFVTQRIAIFQDTVAKNVAYAQEYDEDRAIKALKKAHAWEFVNELPDGIDTVLDEFGANLSGGQRQRIALARALYREPSVLILDEATSALDNKSEKAIQKALEEIKKDMITFVVAHRLTTIENADTILVLENGEIADRGRYNDLLKKSDAFIRLAHAGKKISDK